MAEFASRWLASEPPETKNWGTDKTDERGSVSFVSATEMGFGRVEPDLADDFPADEEGDDVKEENDERRPPRVRALGLANARMLAGWFDRDEIAATLARLEARAAEPGATHTMRQVAHDWREIAAAKEAIG
jgi:hypothetical protein